MDTAPKTTIIGLYEEGPMKITWSDRPVCMGGPTVSYPPGWATSGIYTDDNLPMDPPTAWCYEEELEEAGLV